MSSRKPLVARAYGSIMHLPGSKMVTPADRRLDERAARLYLVKEKPGDEIILTEKLDGSSVAVANVDGVLLPLIRAGYLARDSRYEQHHLFERWFYKNYDSFTFLQPGERVCGEWLLQAHGTRYALDGRRPFVAFDIIRGAGADNHRLRYDEFLDRCRDNVDTVPLLHHGGAISIEEALRLLGPSGSYGAEDVEGCVWRREHLGEYQGLAKYVRPDHPVGRYLDGVDVWNINPFF